MADTHPTLIRERIPRHVAIIMDGNGRWARNRGLSREAGHRAGVETVDRILQASIRIGIRVLTLYTFSSENWRRPRKEINALMQLLHSNLLSQRKKLLENKVRLTISGDIARFPVIVRREMQATVKKTAHCDAIVLNLALGYSGREEILQACRSLAEDAKHNRIDPRNISAELFASRLYTGDLPDPDLIIRTSGEYRLSNFLLWQSSYSEFFFTETLWPDFSETDLVQALESYQKRDRRFGGLSPGEPSK